MATTRKLTVVTGTCLIPTDEEYTWNHPALLDWKLGTLELTAGHPSLRGSGQAILLQVTVSNRCATGRAGPPVTPKRITVAILPSGSNITKWKQCLQRPGRFHLSWSTKKAHGKKITLVKNWDLIVCNLAEQPNRFKGPPIYLMSTGFAPLFFDDPVRDSVSDNALTKNLIAAKPLRRSDNKNSRLSPALSTPNKSTPTCQTYAVQSYPSVKTSAWGAS